MGRRRTAVSLGSALAGWSYDEARLSFQPGEGAVTLDDVIVFSERDVAENVWLWAHELTHVQQYRRLGVDQFAVRYLAEWPALEAEATENAFRITAAIRAAQSG